MDHKSSGRSFQKLLLDEKPSLLFRYVGRRGTFFIAAGLFIGAALFLVELAFAFNLQAILFQLNSTNSSLPRLPLGITLPKTFVGLVILFGVVATIRSLCNFLQSYIQGSMNQWIESIFLQRAFKQIFYNSQLSSASLQSLVLNATNCGLFISAVQGTLFNVSLAVFFWISLFSIMKLNTLIISALMLLLFLPTRKLDVKIIALGQASAKSQVAIQQRIFKAIKNFILLRIYRMQGRELAATNELLKSGLAARQGYIGLQSLKYAFPQLVGSYVLIVLLVLMHSSEFTTTSLSYLYLFIRTVQTLSQINMNLATLNFNSVHFIEYFDWWKENGTDTGLENQSAKSNQFQHLSADKILGSFGWKFSDVEFSYPRDEGFILGPANFTINPGKFTAIIGHSGAGKSTILLLALGLLKPNRGSVRIVSDSSAELAIDNILESIGYVGPEPFTIEGTIRENILYGVPGKISDAQIEEALAQAECTFISGLRSGLNHHLNEQGEGLSAGQKQRLALARALLREPAVLILDEATSNLDVETEAKIISSLKALKKEMTILCVTHRSSLLSVADHVIKLEKAGIISQSSD